MGLRIIAFTDIHGAYSGVEEILARELPADVIIVGGDLTTMGSPGEARTALQRLQRHAATVIAVAGNMDPRDVEDVFVKMNVSISGKGVLIGDIGFFGVSAAPHSPLRTPYEISEEEILKLAELGWEQVAHARRTVFVPHAPPYNTKLDIVHSGKHVGSTAVRKFIESRQPDLVLCGHIHEARGEDTIGRSRILNCGPAGRGHYVTIQCNDSLQAVAH